MVHFKILMSNEIQQVLDILTNCDTSKLGVFRQPTFKFTVWFPTSIGTKLDVKALLLEYEPRIRSCKGDIVAEVSLIDMTTAINFLKACNGVTDFFSRKKKASQRKRKGI